MDRPHQLALAFGHPHHRTALRTARQFPLQRLFNAQTGLADLAGEVDHADESILTFTRYSVEAGLDANLIVRADTLNRLYRRCMLLVLG